MLTADYRFWFAEINGRVERRLEEIMQQPAPELLQTAMRDAVLAGGKRLRPAMVMAVADVDGAPADSLALALEAGCALECLHCYSLVHDDLPCMDNADTRRGRPSSHRAYGEAMALLAGDCLQTLAFSIVAQSGLPVAAVALLAAAAGSKGMGGGQALDLQAVAADEVALRCMHEMKTGALFYCALQLGLLCRREQDARLEAFASPFGLLYQIANDIKDAAVDAAGGKQTYVTVLGESAAQQRAADSHEAAHRALEGKYPLLAVIADDVYAGARV
ncbi:polyprenyl synthetase family protein [Candidatus Persebacteraceae bacterium Df01]|jgi:farnesyl diphosphate synthase|uniref:Polyprenyl synthetase family protein n=1 Tax=Candidatus Doriopsillibacter californiensis TaxID=2970740 RepID=A0ABT7QKP4_9GAMM|nr:polyprenyl synthetase family protein [Candidatus Persebacteraceae bacterium Df01]